MPDAFHVNVAGAPKTNGGWAVPRTPHPGGYGTVSPGAGGAPGTFSAERPRAASGVSSR